MSEYTEEEYLMLSGLQHFIFCPRQWALIHLEQVWAENIRTVEGNIVHEICHDGDFFEARGNILILRGLNVSSRVLGVSGQCDVVEFHKRNDDKGAILYGRPGSYDIFPVEYKRGKPKVGKEDISQLCGQAICLEEMFGISVNEGYLYYNEIRRREKVLFTKELRVFVTDSLKEMHACFNRGITPKVKTGGKCRNCSLKDSCLPKLNKQISVGEYYRQRIEVAE